MKEIKVKVQGMTCSSCEVLIERSLRKVLGVEKVRVSRSREDAKITCADDVSLATLQAAIPDQKYILTPFDAASSSQLWHKSPRKYAEIGAAFLFIIGIYLLLKQFEILPENLGVTDNMSYGFIFVLGLVAATSTCLAVAGGLLLVIANKYAEKFPHATGWQKFKPHIYFNIGRVAGYTLLGALVGMLGSFLTLSPLVTGIITILASILMVIMGLQLLQIFPWLNKIQVKMPKFIAHRMYDAGTEQIKPYSSALFGAATFFLPCGFTQALQLYVLSQGDPLIGGLTMLAFSLGTLPALAGIGAFSSFVKGNIQRHFMTISAVLVIILGLWNIPNGVALTGTNFGSEFETVNALLPSPSVGSESGKQVISMVVNGYDYSPNSFTLTQGVPVEWRIDARNAQGCAQVISVPGLGITEYLPRDQVKVVAFTPTQAGSIRFSCSMGMAGPGVFNIIPNQNQVQAAPIANSPPPQVCDPTVMQCNVQKLQMEISRERGFYPNQFTVKTGIPVEMEIDTQVPMGGCMSTLVIPQYNIAHRLELGKTILRFTPTSSGIVPFTCSMGSHLGDFIVA